MKHKLSTKAFVSGVGDEVSCGNTAASCFVWAVVFYRNPEFAYKVQGKQVSEMSQTDAIVVQVAEIDNKSTDKKEIEDEEREKMLNEENKQIDEALKADADIIKPAENITGEGREVKPKFIPIGAIKMPGFFTRNKPKDKAKDGEDGAQGELLEKNTEGTEENKEETETPQQPSLKSRITSIKIPTSIKNPFTKKPKTVEAPTPVPAAEGEETKEAPEATQEPGQRRMFLNLNTIKLPPLSSVIPKKFRSQSASQDAESGLDGTKTAGLASMETLDDNKETDEKKAEAEAKTEDGMESIKLDVEEVVDGEDPTQNKGGKLSLRERIRQQKFIIDDLAIAGGSLLFLILVIIIIIVAFSGNTLVVAPIKDGKYVDAVTSCGLVEGVLEDGAFAFRGIPYARPPIGANRFKPAKLIDSIDACWNGTLQVHNATAPCLQVYGNGTVDGVEDCLTLDVITPHVRYDNPLPVIVLIGSNTLTGGSPGKLRPSTRYARSKDVLFVRPNFRIGVFGFLAVKSLSQSVYPSTSGNYGLSDIIATLQWIQLNIKNFGGDPKAVTLFGHRAGATLVTALMGYKKAKTLFARAWVSSGSALYPGKPLEQYEEMNEKYMDVVDCKDVECLRKLDVDQIMRSVPDTWRGDFPDLPDRKEDPNSRHEWLVLDHNIITGHIADSLPVSEIPIVIGTTAHVGASEKLFLRYPNWTTELVTDYVKSKKIGEVNLAEEALIRYNATYQGLAAMISDIRTLCPLLTMARYKPSIPFYIVTQPSGEQNIADVDSDISAILGRYEPKTPEQRRYVAAMQQLFYHYVWHGVVPQAEKHNYPMLEVGQDVLPIKGYPNCDFWVSKDIIPRYARQD